MSVDFDEEVHSEFKASLTWTRIVVVLYGVLCFISMYVPFADPVPGIPIEFRKYIFVLGIVLIFLGVILPKSPIAIGSLLIAIAVALQAFLFITSGQVSIYLFVVIVIGAWNLYSYVSFQKFAKTHLNPPTDDDLDR